MKINVLSNTICTKVDIRLDPSEKIEAVWPQYDDRSKIESISLRNKADTVRIEVGMCDGLFKQSTSQQLRDIQAWLVTSANTMLNSAELIAQRLKSIT